MEVGVDEARDDQLVGAVDNVGSIRSGNVISDRGDTVTLDQDVAFERRRAMGAIHRQYGRVADKQGHESLRC
jgi:hypothetical protein